MLITCLSNTLMILTISRKIADSYRKILNLFETGQNLKNFKSNTVESLKLAVAKSWRQKSLNFKLSPKNSILNETSEIMTTD